MYRRERVGGTAGGDGRIRVLICDDSAVIRGILAQILLAEPDIELVASAHDGRQAVEGLRRVGADIVILDLEMGGMDGLTALPLLLEVDPRVRVIIASSLTTAGAAVTIRALQAGAADYAHKPGAGSRDIFVRELLGKIRALAPRTATLPRQPAAPSVPPAAGDTILGHKLRSRGLEAPLLLAIGSSTGGPQALFSLFGALSRRLPVPVVLTQHMPPLFTRSLAEHLTRLGHRLCQEAEDRMPLLPDNVYVAPGDRHLLVETDPSGGLVARLSDGPMENSCRPAVDPMLRSAARTCRGRVLAVILTGMGRDGCSGAEDLVARGGTVLAQDEASSVVWGMPGAVTRAGLCHAVLPLDQIAPRIVDLLGSGARHAA